MTGRLTARAPGHLVAIISAALALSACSSAATPGSSSGTSTTAAPTTTAAPLHALATVALQMPNALARSVVLPQGAHHLLILGGLDSADQSVSGVYRLNLSTGNITNVGSLTQPTHDAAGAVIGGAYYVFGGGQAASSAAIQRWTSSGGTTISGTLPALRSDLAAATVNGTAYLAGGYTGSTLLHAVWATKGHTVHQVARLLQPVRYAAVAALGNTLWVIGGMQPSGSTRYVQAVNLQTGQARIVGMLPQRLSQAVAVTLAGHLLVFGGRQAGAVSDAIWELDPATGALQQIGRLPLPMENGAATVTGGSAWLVGGAGATGSLLTQVLRIRLTGG